MGRPGRSVGIGAFAVHGHAVGKAAYFDSVGLEVLDGVAARGQVGAPVAAKRARAERVAEVNRLLASGAAPAANSALLKWFPAWEGDGELRAVRARACEAEAMGCGEDRLCLLVATRNAARAEATPARTQAEASARQAVQSTLTFSEVLGEPGTARLKRLKAAAELRSAHHEGE